MATETFLRPEHLAPVRNLNLRAKLIVEGMMAGLHKSPYHGFSAEFSEYRPYRPGESIRSIDWRKYAKTDRFYVRLFEDETNLAAHILLDKSASMAFSAQGRMDKFDYSRTLAASIAWILVRQRDAVALAAFDEQLSTFLPPRSTNVQLRNITATLETLRPGSATRCGTSINRLAEGISRRGLTVIISDLFDEPSEILNGLRHLRYKRQDVILIQVTDPFEHSFDRNYSYHLRDMESGRDLLLDGKSAADHLHEAMARHRETIVNGCRELRVDFSPIKTDEPFARALMKIVRTRRQLC